MARTYNLTHLALNDPTSANWALAYVRFALRDKPNDADAYPANSLEDEEINAILEAEKVTDSTDMGGDGTSYYEPHKTAARILSANPEVVTRFSAGGYSEETRPVAALVHAIRRQGRWIDDSIIDSTDGRLGGQSLVLRL